MARMASVRVLRTRAERLRADQAEQLKQLVLELPDLPQRAVGEILVAVARLTEPERDGWRFIMVGPEEFDAVAEWLEAHSRRPRTALRLWRKIFRFIRTDTGEIVRTRDELAELVGCRPNEITEVMGELARLGAVRSVREPVPGQRGRGPVRWYLNPRIGTHLPHAARVEAQAEAPQLRLAD